LIEITIDENEWYGEFGVVEQWILLIIQQSYIMKLMNNLVSISCISDESG